MASARKILPTHGRRSRFTALRPLQSVFLDAAKYRLAQRESQSKMDRSVPPVQRPGVSVDGNADTGVERAIARFNANPGPKTGAALRDARRLATRK